MNKLFLLILIILIFVLITPSAFSAGWWDPFSNMGNTSSRNNASATLPPCEKTGESTTGIVPCGTTCSCTIENFFLMLGKIYDFMVKMIATPLAVISLTVGGIFMLISAGNPDLLGKGKKILYAAIIGLVLVWASWLIINTILCTILGYCTWSTL